MDRQAAAAYRSGAAAFRNGKALEANPYNKGTHEHHCWMVAHINARLVAEAEADAKADDVTGWYEALFPAKREG